MTTVGQVVTRTTPPLIWWNYPERPPTASELALIGKALLLNGISDLDSDTTSEESDYIQVQGLNKQLLEDLDKQKQTAKKNKNNRKSQGDQREEKT